MYHVTSWTGEPVETDEMPQWFAKESIPYEQMWSDDVYWLPLLLEKKSFIGHFHFDTPATEDHPAMIMSYDIREVSESELLGKADIL